MRSYQRNQEQWQAALTDPATAISHRMMVKDVGSEFTRRMVLEPQLRGHATDGLTVVLIGRGGLRELEIPSGNAVALEQINLHVIGDDPALSVLASRVEVLVNGRTVDWLPPFRLDEWARGDNGLKFGAIPVGIWLTKDSQLSVRLVPSGTAGATINLDLSATLRLEPRWLAQAAGLLDPENNGA